MDTNMNEKIHHVSIFSGVILLLPVWDCAAVPYCSEPQQSVSHMFVLPNFLLGFAFLFPLLFSRICI